MSGNESLPEPQQPSYGAWGDPGPNDPWDRPDASVPTPGPAYSAAPQLGPTGATASSATPMPAASGSGTGSWGRPGGLPPLASLMPQTTPIDPYAQNASPTRKRKRRTGLAFAVIGTIAASGIVGGAAGALTSHDSAAPTAASSSSNIVAPVSDITSSTTVGAVAKAVLPSVVQVTITTYSGKELGSGIILTSDGTILTNNHVVAGAADGAGTMTVTFNDGKTVSASIVGTDSSSDLAVIKAAGVSGLTPATLGDSSKVQIGDTVIAIGSPEGLQGTVTSGIVSALNRQVTVGTSSNTSRFQQNADSSVTYNAIQTDASINPGNSGGPLLNTAGQVIGINSAIYSPTTSYTGQGGSVGLGFSIPINQVKSLISKLESGYQG